MITLCTLLASQKYCTALVCTNQVEMRGSPAKASSLHYLTVTSEITISGEQHNVNFNFLWSGFRQTHNWSSKSPTSNQSFYRHLWLCNKCRQHYLVTVHDSWHQGWNQSHHHALGAIRTSWLHNTEMKKNVKSDSGVTLRNGLSRTGSIQHHCRE